MSRLRRSRRQGRRSTRFGSGQWVPLQYRLGARRCLVAVWWCEMMLIFRLYVDRLGMRDRRVRVRTCRTAGQTTDEP
jgi:hypothetical protein